VPIYKRLAGKQGTMGPKQKKMTQIESQIFEKDDQMAFIDDNFFDDFDDADGQLTTKLE